MKRNHTVFVIIGIVAVCTFGLTLISGAQSNAQSDSRQNIRSDRRQMPGRQTEMTQNPKGGKQGRQPGGGMGFGLNLAGVELSDEQKEQMQQQMRNFQVNSAEVRQRLQFAEQDLRQEMRNDTADQTKIDSLWAEITSLKQELGQAQTDHMLAMKGILTPEQLATIQANEAVAIELQKLRLEQRELLLASGAPNVQRLQQIQAEIAQKETVLQRERVKSVAERFENLTPEEQEQFQNNRGGRKQTKSRR